MFSFLKKDYRAMLEKEFGYDKEWLTMLSDKECKAEYEIITVRG